MSGGYEPQKEFYRDRKEFRILSKGDGEIIVNPEKLVRIMSDKLITLNNFTNNKLNHPKVWNSSADDDREPLRRFTWENEDGALLEMSIYEDSYVEFELVAGNDEILMVMLGDSLSEVYSWDNFPMNILNQFCKF